MTATIDEIKIRGKAFRVAAAEIDGRTVVVSGHWFKVAAVKDEELVEGTLIARPDIFIAALRRSGLRADVFTFAEALGVKDPSHALPFEWDNAAAIETSSFDAWWNKLHQSARKNVRRSERLGVAVKQARLDTDFAMGIKRIYDESPYRQGRPFWHYQKDLEIVMAENGTYADRSELIGAYHNDELIGFMKWVYVGPVAQIVQILSFNSQSDKRPMNALIATAVAICARRGVTHLVYGRYTYGNKVDSTLAEFKRRNGFEQINFPRYYIPLTLKGRLGLRAGAHRGWVGILPKPIIALLITVRSNWNSRFRN